MEFEEYLSRVQCVRTLINSRRFGLRIPFCSSLLLTNTPTHPVPASLISLTLTPSLIMAVVIPIYTRMHRAGHPVEVVAMRLAVDMQCSPTDPAVLRFIEAIESDPIPAEIVSGLNQLAVSKYQRMRDHHATEGQVRLTAFYDNVAAHKAIERGELASDAPLPDVAPIDVSVPLPEGGSDGAVDVIIGDRYSAAAAAAANDAMTPAQRRAVELKQEARRSARDYYRHLFSVATSSSSSKSASLSTAHEQEEDDTAPIGVAAAGAKKVVAAAPLTFAAAPAVEPQRVFEPFEHPSTEAMVVAKCMLDARMYVFDHAVPAAECEALVQTLDFTTEEEAVQDAVVEQLRRDGNQVMRTSLRRKIVHAELAGMVWEAIKHHLPPQLDDGRQLVGIRSRMNFYRYGAGQFFDTHLDGGTLLCRDRSHIAHRKALVWHWS